MNCRGFERELDGLFAPPSDGGPDSDGQIAPEVREALEMHAAQCPSCSELLELACLPRLSPAARLAQNALGDFTAEVLSRTSGSPCTQAERSLPELVDGVIAAGDRALLAEHLEHCQACSELEVELERLAIDLPRLAIVRPEISIVDDVLRRTLPVSVQLRRWWSVAWPRWVRRPRFASELAYIATLVLVVVFGSPVSPLAAMPERALELTRSEKLEILNGATRAEISAKVQATANTGAERARSLAASARRGFGTILDEVASWFENAEDEPPAKANQTTEETS